MSIKTPIDSISPWSDSAALRQVNIWYKTSQEPLIHFTVSSSNPEHTHSLHPPPPSGWWREKVEPFFRFWVKSGILVGGDFFEVVIWKLLYKKLSIWISNQKKNYNCNFYNFSLLVSYPDNFMVVCTSIWYILSHKPTFFVEVKKVFCILLPGVGKISNFLGGTFCIGGT